MLPDISQQTWEAHCLQFTILSSHPLVQKIKFFKKKNAEEMATQISLCVYCHRKFPPQHTRSRRI